MTQAEKDQLLNEQHTIKLDREVKLARTDYVAAKIAEGAATKSEYSEVIAQRKQWRVDLNAAEARIKELKSIDTEDENPSENI